MRYIIFALLIYVITGCTDETQQENPEKVIPVKSVQVKYEELSVPVHLTGVLQAEAEMKLSFKIGGIIQALKIEEGMWVKKKQVSI